VGTAAILEGLRLVDHHCHGVVRRDLDRSGFEALISEAAHAASGSDLGELDRRELSLIGRTAPLAVRVLRA